MTNFVRKKNCEATELDEEWIILNTDNFTVTKLNGVGGFCWSLLREKQTVDTIVEAIEQNFDTTNGLKKEDIEEFLAELIHCGVIQSA